jgi:dCTP deaminase
MGQIVTLFADGIRAAMSRPELEKRLMITPLLDGAQIGSGTVDLRLGTEFIEVDRSGQRVIDVRDQSTTAQEIRRERRTVLALGQGLALHPGQFILGSSLEFLHLPADISGQVLSRSSWGRLGLLVATAVAVQPGFRGVLTLELVNHGNVPIMLRPGARVAQLQLWKSDEPTTTPYSRTGRYLVPTGPETARLQREAEEAAKLHLIGLDMSYDLNEDDPGQQQDAVGAERNPADDDVEAGSGEA